MLTLSQYCPIFRTISCILHHYILEITTISSISAQLSANISFSTPIIIFLKHLQSNPLFNRGQAEVGTHLYIFWQIYLVKAIFTVLAPKVTFRSIFSPKSRKRSFLRSGQNIVKKPPEKQNFRKKCKKRDRHSAFSIVIYDFFESMYTYT